MTMTTRTMTDRSSTSAERATRLAALQDRSVAGGRRHEPPAQISKIITTGLAASLTLGLVTAMGWSNADAGDEPAVPTAPPAAGAGTTSPAPATVAPVTAVPVSTLVDAAATVPTPVVAAAPVVVTQATPAPAPAPAPAPVVIDVAVPTPQPAPAAPASGGGSGGGGSSNGSTKQSK
jgi:hypothetical protein